MNKKICNAFSKEILAKKLLDHCTLISEFNKPKWYLKIKELNLIPTCVSNKIATSLTTLCANTLVNPRVSFGTLSLL